MPPPAQPPPKFPPELRAEIVAYSVEHGLYRAMAKYQVSRTGLRRWCSEAGVKSSEVKPPELRKKPGRKPKAVPSAPEPGAKRAPSKPSRLPLKAAIDRIRQEADKRDEPLSRVVGELFDGIFLPQGDPIPDLPLVLAIPGVVELGSRTSGGTSRSSGQKDRANRTSRERREGEHASAAGA